MDFKYLILGGGPCGLTIANRLYQGGERSFLLLEKEDECGGLCRSQMVDGSEIDIGGGHFLDVRRPVVNEFLFRFMPEDEWDVFNRDSRIALPSCEVHHPLEANIWEMPPEEQRRFLTSIAKAGCNMGKEMPVMFTDWITWKLGEVIAREYMLPYNRKMFGRELDQLGTYWLEKLPNVSFEETKRSCEEHKAFGTQPGHAQFYYPKAYGYGELWRRMQNAISAHVRCNVTVCKVDFNSCSVETDSGEVIKAEKIYTTIPWSSIAEFHGLPEDLHSDIGRLKHTGVRIEYHGEDLDTAAQWIYYPDERLRHHRILVRHNFCNGSRGYWTETNLDRVTVSEGTYFDNEYAYPLNTIEKPQIMEKLLAWASARNVFGVGRWGEHQHYNSDATVERALNIQL